MTSPTDEDMDDIHHALGRPDGPHVEPYRKHYVVGMATSKAARLQALGLWTLVRRINQGADGVFEVNEAGIAALWPWLAERQRAEGQRLFTVSARGCTPRKVLAKSPSAAKYDLYLSLHDAGWVSDWRGFLALKPTAVTA